MTSLVSHETLKSLMALLEREIKIPGLTATDNNNDTYFINFGKMPPIKLDFGALKYQEPLLVRKMHR